MGETPRITAVVVACDEAHLLPPCLRGLSFCDEVIVVDLESTDGSGAVAGDMGARVLRHARVPVVEWVREAAAARARNDWILFVDPDEVVPPSLATAITQELEANPDTAGVRLPSRFYFRGEPLRCTVWGQPGHAKRILVHRKRVRFPRLVHTEIEPLDGFHATEVPTQGDRHIRHYWARSYSELLRKHRRYLVHEGDARYARGERFSWTALVRQTAAVAKRNLMDYGGARGGVPGIFLSCLHTWYVCMGWLALRRHQRTLATR